MHGAPGQSGHAVTTLPLSVAKGLPGSAGFLTPETVHEAFAGNSFLRSQGPDQDKPR